MARKSDKIVVLLVMPPDSSGFAGILSSLETFEFDLAVVSDCRGVRRQIHLTEPTVVICGVSLCDGNWCDVLSCVVDSEVSASVVVYSHEIDDRLRSEAISRGAYDLLSNPVGVEQLRHCIEEAHEYHQEPLSRTVRAW